jgi:hypothetical protein
VHTGIRGYVPESLRGMRYDSGRDMSVTINGCIGESTGVDLESIELGEE